MRFHRTILIVVLAAALVACRSDRPPRDSNGEGTGAPNGAALFGGTSGTSSAGAPAGSAAVPSSVSASGPRVAAPAPATEPKAVRVPHYDRPGYSAVLSDGRLWVFPAASAALADFLAGNEPAKNVSRIKAGPGGMTLRSVEPEWIDGYLAAKRGFVTEIVDGRIWVFRPGTEALSEFRAVGEPAKSVTRPKAGPAGMTVRGPDMATVIEYITAKPGFETRYDDGRLWVFPQGSKALAEYEAVGEPAKSVTRVKAGPMGMTVRAPDMQVVNEYMAAADGFTTFVVDGRIWVFEPGSPDIDEFREVGEPAKHVTKPASGPLRMTVKGPDFAIINDYLRTVNAQ